MSSITFHKGEPRVDRYLVRQAVRDLQFQGKYRFGQVQRTRFSGDHLHDAFDDPTQEMGGERCPC